MGSIIIVINIIIVIIMFLVSIIIVFLCTGKALNKALKRIELQ